MDLQTRVDGASDPEITKQYSIREQIEYFDRKRELQRRASLEERRLRQEARDQELAERQLEYERQRLENPQPETVIINQYPRYRPINRHGRFRQPRGVQVHNPYMLQYEHVGDHHRFNLDVGRPYPSYPLNFWKH